MRDAGLALTRTSIDPAPRREIEEVADVVIRRSVLGSDAITLTASLDEKDALFIDGSYYVFYGTDVPFLFLEVPLQLKPGVAIHIHDIMLPCEHDTPFSERNYSAQYLLAGPLLGGGNWAPLLPVYWLSREGRATYGTSFWKRRGAGRN